MAITTPIHSSSYLIKAVNSKNAFTIKGFQQNQLPYLEKFTPKVLAVTAGLWGLHALYRTIVPRQSDILELDGDNHKNKDKGKNIFMNTLDNIDRSLCEFNKSITSTKVFFGAALGGYLLEKYTKSPTNIKFFTHYGIYFLLYTLVNNAIVNNAIVNNAMQNPKNITSTGKTFDENKLEGFSAQLKEKIKGQDHVATQIHKELETSQILKPEHRKTRGNFLFMGTPGTGKTQTAIEIAEHLDIPLVQFNMSMYNKQEDMHSFFGTQNVYKNSDKGGFAKALEKSPSFVLLLDEMEKSHSQIKQAFLDMLNSGKFTDKNTGNTYDLKDVIIIMTTNCHNNALKKVSLKNAMSDNNLNRENEEHNKKHISRNFSPEFLNRIFQDNQITFNPLSTEVKKDIIEQKCKALEGQLDENLKIKLQFDDSVYTYFANQLTSDTISARNIEGTVKDKILSKIAENKETYKNKTVNITSDNNQDIKFTATETASG